MTEILQRRRRRIVKIVENVKRYRLPFYDGLSRRLGEEGIDFQLYFSVAIGEEVSKGDTVSFSRHYSRCVDVQRVGPLVMQKLPWNAIANSDGVIAVRANRLANNYRLTMARHTSGLNLAWWGHAYNYQSQQNSLSERFKRRLARSADWWFSYLPESQNYLAQIGFDARRVTPVENSVSIVEFHNFSDLESDRSLRKKWNFGEDADFVIFSGSLYRNKMLDFLFETLQLVRKRRSEAELIVIGDGPLRGEVTAWAKSNSWLHYLGPRYDREKAELFAISKFVVNPGLVGLGIIDSFASGRPLLTTNCGFHSPEIEYLRNGVNGLIVEPYVTAYADAVVRLMENPDVLHSLADGARASGRVHTVEKMIEGVANGIHTWLACS